VAIYHKNARFLYEMQMSYDGHALTNNNCQSLLDNISL